MPAHSQENENVISVNTLQSLEPHSQAEIDGTIGSTATVANAIGGAEKLSIQQDSMPPVDGGLHAWTVVTGASLALFIQFGLGEFCNVFTKYSLFLHLPCNGRSREQLWCISTVCEYFSSLWILLCTLIHAFRTYSTRNINSPVYLPKTSVGSARSSSFWW